jgi:hypothetical protein
MAIEKKNIVHKGPKISSEFVADGDSLEDTLAVTGKKVRDVNLTTSM